MHLHVARPFLLTGERGLATFSILHQFFAILQFSTLGPLKLLRLSTKVDGRRNCQKPLVYDTFVPKNWTVSRGIATFVHSHARFGHNSFWIAFVIEIVIAFVMPTLAQINFTIASTTPIVPLSLCMYMHRSTLVYIYI